MHIEFPFPGYENIAGCDFPDTNLLGIWGTRDHPEVDQEKIVREGFAAPHGRRRLREEVRASDRVLILVDDATRQTPVPLLMPHVLEELRAAGVPKSQVTILTAQGTHREMKPDELRRKLGAFYDQLRVEQHNWKKSPLVSFGQTRDGTPVTANALIAEHDYVLGLGNITPHRVKGFSGGAKIMFPGVSGHEMMDRNQWEASMQMSETVMGVAENSMRWRMEEAAQIAGLRYIVNTVLDASQRVIGCFAGDPVKAHRAACPLAREVNLARLPHRADIVISDAYPQDRDFWQSAKGMYSGTCAVKDGGTLITVAPNPEGVASNHPNLLEIGYRPHAELVAMVQSGKAQDLVGIAILADVAQIVDYCHVTMVSPGVKRKDAEKIGLEYADTVAEALQAALRRHGPDASIAVLHHGGHVCPVADDTSAALGKLPGRGK